MRDSERELLAKYLNNLCCDWPPISMDWDSKGPGCAPRRRQMREIAATFLEQRDRLLSQVRGQG